MAKIQKVSEETLADVVNIELPATSLAPDLVYALAVEVYVRRVERRVTLGLNRIEELLREADELRRSDPRLERRGASLRMDLLSIAVDDLRTTLSLTEGLPSLADYDE